MKQKSFLLYIDQKKIIDKLSDEQAGKLLKYIYNYAAGDDIIIDDLVIDIAFTNIQSHMDRDKAKWDRTKERRSAAGKKGGRPKKESVNEKLTEKANAFLEKPTKAKKAVNDNDNVNVNDNDNVNDNANDNDIKEKKSLSFSYDQMDNPSLMILEDYEKKASAIVSKYFTDLNFEQEDFMVYSDEKINKADIDISFPMKRVNRAFLTYIYRMNINNIQMVQVLIKSIHHKNGSFTSKFIIDKITQNIQYAYHRNYTQFYLENIK